MSLRFGPREGRDGLTLKGPAPSPSEAKPLPMWKEFSLGLGLGVHSYDPSPSQRLCTARQWLPSSPGQGRIPQCGPESCALLASQILRLPSPIGACAGARVPGNLGPERRQLFGFLLSQECAALGVCGLCLGTHGMNKEVSAKAKEEIGG